MKQKRTRNLHPAGMGAKTCSGFASALYSRQAGGLLISSTIQRVHVAIPYIIGPQSYCIGSAFMDPLAPLSWRQTTSDAHQPVYTLGGIDRSAERLRA